VQSIDFNFFFFKGPDTSEERARKTIIKCLNAMHADVELPATLAATYLLNIPDHYTSHQFTFIFTKYFVHAITLPAGVTSMQVDINVTTESEGVFDCFFYTISFFLTLSFLFLHR
jgi:hypothetical protein